MLGILFAILSGFFKGFEKIVHRYVLVKEDSLAYAFLWHLLSSLFLIPFALYEFYTIGFDLPSSPFVWGLVILSSAFWAISAYLGFKSYTTVEVGLKEIFSKSKVIFVFLLSIFLLREVLTLEKALSVILIFIALVIVAYKKGEHLGTLKDKGVQYAIASSLVMSFALIIDKYCQTYFQSGFYSFLVYAIPTLILLPFVIPKTKELESLCRKNFLFVGLSVVLGTMYYYLMLRAFRLADASLVYPIVESSIVITIIAGFFILKEKKDLAKRMLAAGIILLALVILGLSS